MKTRKRSIFVIIFILICSLYFYITLRGEYLQIKGIGEEYLEIFRQNTFQKLIVFLISFSTIYILTYISTLFVKKVLKKFFEEDKIEMPKLPNKSISLAFGAILGIVLTSTLTEKAILAFNSASFGISDPVFNIDIGYYIFQKPFIEAILINCMLFIAILSIYVVTYNIIVFNKFFNEGISMETLKKTFVKHLIINVLIISILISIFTIVKIQNIVLEKFMTTQNGTSLYGAGAIDITLKTGGYLLFALLIPTCTILASRSLKKGNTKKILRYILVIPAYLILLFIVMAVADLLFVSRNELDKEKTYIENNISFTKNAYNIDIEEIELENGGTIKSEDISKNQQVINNINLLNKNVVLSNLKEYQTSLGYYTFNDTKVGLYNNELVYVTPREIVSNNTRTYNSKTYEYTHGYGVIINSASKTDERGYLDYIKNGFTETDDSILINEPRIYFGMQTNESIVINSKSKTEYDYPLTSKTNSYTTYNGKAGLNLTFLDRLLLGIKTKNLKLSFSGNNESKIITDRNIIERAKIVMPYLIYDENPYLVITDDGKLVWVLDAYTVSDNYPYSQITYINLGNEETKKINYIRNSVKVLIDAYDGTMKFYITDRNDPIIMAYWKRYPSLFQNIDKTTIPEDISKHLVYSEYLYNIQANILQTYHNMQSEVLYRADDVWSLAKCNTTFVSNSNGSNIKPYYTILKTVDSENSSLGLVVPYTIEGKQNIVSYLVGTYDSNSNKTVLKIYKFKGNNALLGINQLDSLINEDEIISKEIDALNVTGTRVEKNIIVVPINNTLIYIEPIYQIKLNESNVPVLKKVIVASGNKVAIGNDLRSALENLVSKEAVSIDVEAENIDGLILEIINANKNLESSNESNNWEMIGKDLSKLQKLIKQLEELVKKDNEKQNEISNIVSEIM